MTASNFRRLVVLETKPGAISHSNRLSLERTQKNKVSSVMLTQSNGPCGITATNWVVELKETTAWPSPQQRIEARPVPEPDVRKGHVEVFSKEHAEEYAKEHT